MCRSGGYRVPSVTRKSSSYESRGLRVCVLLHTCAWLCGASQSDVAVPRVSLGEASSAVRALHSTRDKATLARGGRVTGFRAVRTREPQFPPPRSPGIFLPCLRLVRGAPHRPSPAQPFQQDLQLWSEEPLLP